eukprot:TRINITY_DN9685_c0_g1_i1.p1 TRINITY_DN9685_c0_g1~~TRINITY_DN9685_c0_g1_i1.p1  ORF type:complete len:293 (+),score=120.54 TRINITY_DN9685_c0_g1_i1:110-988(+)
MATFAVDGLDDGGTAGAIEGAPSQYKIDPEESAKYFDQVEAPSLFEKMAMELLKCKPVKGEVLSMLIDVLLKEKKIAELKAQQVAADEIRATKLFNHLTGEGEVRIAWGAFLAKLQLDDAFAKALLPYLKPDGEGYLNAEAWGSWLATSQNPSQALDWIEERLLLCPVPGWTADFEKRVRDAFDMIDKRFEWNGEVDHTELMSVMSKFTLTAKVLFKELDCNADGGVSITEWLTWFKKICMTEGPEIAMDRLEWIEECLQETDKTSSDDLMRERAAQLNTALEDLAAKVCGV